MREVWYQTVATGGRGDRGQGPWRGANIEAKNSNELKACGGIFFVPRAWIIGYNF